MSRARARARAAALAASSLAALCALLGCSHDLDALRAERDHAGLRAGSGGGGSRGGGAGGSGASGAGGDAGPAADAGGGSGGSGGSSSAGPCEPCPEVSKQAEMLGLRACCRGATDLECGLTAGEGTLCLPRDVPDQASDVCPEARMGPLTLSGCCRPDGRCGVLAGQIGLGCAARDEIFPALGLASPMPIACQFACAEDTDCGAAGAGLVCAEHQSDRSKRFCADECARDRDCSRDFVCVLSNDVGLDRVLAVCGKPLGTAAPGEACVTAGDCENGVCTRLDSGGPPFCAELCGTAADCGPTAKRCVITPIDSPSGRDDANTFKVCLP